jgi:parallel beta-helix repeat protein
MIFYFFLFTFLISKIYATDIYISTTGSDSNDGTQNAPFLTPQRAQVAIATAKSSNGGQLPDNYIVHFAPGLYFLNSTLNITIADSGDTTHSVTWSGPGPQTPAIISAGMLLSGWTVLNGFPGVYTVSVPNLLFVRQMWQVGGGRRFLSRTPIKTARSVGQWGVAFQPGDVLPPSATVNYTEAEFVIWHNWVNSQNKIQYVNFTNSSITPKGECGDSFFNAGGLRWALQNVADPQNLIPGQFYFSSNTITYKALPGEDPTVPSNIQFIIERFTTAISLYGTSSGLITNTNFVNISIAHASADLEHNCISGGCGGQSCSETGTAAVHALYTTNSVFDNVEVFGTGSYALWFDQNCTLSTVSRSYFHDLGMGAIRVGSPSQTSGTANITITDSIITDGGHVVPAGTGILAQECIRTTIVHNEIYNLYYTGVSTGWTWGYSADEDVGHNVSFNRIHDIFQGQLSDGGCVYNLGRSPGTVISNNICHSVSSYNYGGWGYYLDEGSSNVTVQNNIVFNTRDAGFHQHYGTDNVITNNIIAFASSLPCGPTDDCDLSAVRSSQHGSGAPGTGVNSSFAFHTNIIYLGNANGVAWEVNNSNVFTTYVKFYCPLLLTLHVSSVMPP